MVERVLRHPASRSRTIIGKMTDYRYTVVHMGLHPRDQLEPERVELERMGARQVVLKRLGSEDEVIEQVREADGLIVPSAAVRRPMISSLERCKVIMRTGVGVDTIDVDAATERGIAVVNVPDLWIREVANHALALLLALNRRLLRLDRAVRGGEWRPLIPPPVGSLHGETLGLVGLGRIGRALASRAAAMDMDVVAYDAYIPDPVFQDVGAESVSFDELLRRSDYISIHCPLTDETRHLFDEDAFKKMKATSYLINTARGPIVKHEALVRALQEGRIAGAGIDVLEHEPPSFDDPLMGMENVILTPHTSYYSDSAVQHLAVRCGQEVARVLTGRMPLNLVNPEVLEKLPLTPE